MSLEKFILPYPYEAFNKHNRVMNTSFESYKEKIYEWVRSNSNEEDHSLLVDNINSCFCYMEKTKVYDEIREWMINHKDKMKYFHDFSGLDFGIRFHVEYESISICRPIFIDDEDKDLYPNYSEVEFLHLSIMDKLNWLYEHCEFIPFRMMYENVDDGGSHKYSHILRDRYANAKIKDYIKSLPFPPNKAAYYSIEFDAKKKTWYLKRDLNKSPRKERSKI